MAFAFTNKGPTPNNSFSGIPNISQPKKSNILSGASINKEVNSGLMQGGKPIKTSVPITKTQSSMPMPSNWTSGLGMSPSFGGTNKPQTNIKGLLNSTTPNRNLFGSGNKDIKSITQPDGTKIDLYSDNKESKSTTSSSTYDPANPPAPIIAKENPYVPPATAQYPGINNTPSPTSTTTQPDQGKIIENIQKAGQTTPDEKAFQDQYVKSVAGKQFGSLAPYAESSMYVGKTPEEIQGLITAPDLVGRSSANKGLYDALGNAYGNAALAGLSAAQTSAARNLSAQQAAGSLNAPVSQFGMLTNPTSGQIVGGNGAVASNVMQSALQNAIKMIQSGQTSYQDAYNTSGLATFGVLGQTALQNALSQGGTFSPTTQNTQVAVNQANLDSTQKQAFSVNQSLQQVEKIEPVLTSFLQSSGINPFEAQIYNGPVNDYLRSLGNSGAAAQWGAQMSELKNYTSQLIASGYGGTPTGAEAATLSQDPSNLSYSGLKAYLQTLKDLGNNRLNVLQSDIQKLGGTGIGYVGNPAPVATSTTPSQGAAGSGEIGTGITSPAGQYGAGLGLNIAPGLASAATQGGLVAAGAKILKFIGL